MTERFGGRLTGLIGLSLTLVPLTIAWRLADNFASFLGASGWYPPEHQGLAMGIAGAGNSGTLLSTLFAPRLAQAFGWHNVFAIAAVPICIVWVIFFVLARNSPAPRRVRKWAEYAALFKVADTGWFCFIYCLTFGGFVGLSSYLSIFFHDQYRLTKVQSGDFTTVVVLCGSFLRPVGGVLSDRWGGYRMLLGVLCGAAVCLGLVAILPPVFWALTVLAIAMGLLGMGNGSVFQLLPQRFAEQIGIMTGVVGAAGGIGGFLLPSLLGYVKGSSGSFGIGFALLGLLAVSGAASLWYLKAIWRRNWPAQAAWRAGLLDQEDLSPTENYATSA